MWGVLYIVSIWGRLSLNFQTYTSRAVLAAWGKQSAMDNKEEVKQNLFAVDLPPAVRRYPAAVAEPPLPAGCPAVATCCRPTAACWPAARPA